MMSIERISVAVVVLMVTIIVSNTVHCTPTSDAATVLPEAPFSMNLPASNAHATLSDEVLNALKNFHHSQSPGKGSEMPATETVPNSPPLMTDRISIMRFPAAPALGSIDGDQSSRSSANPAATTNPIVPSGLQPQLQRHVGQNPQTPDRGNDEMAESPLPSLALLQQQSRKPSTGKPFMVSVPPLIAGTDPLSAAQSQSSSPIAIPPTSPHSSNPTLLKIEPIKLSPNFNQELSKLLTNLPMNSSTLQEITAVALDKNKILSPGPAPRPAETLPLIISPSAPGSPASHQPPKVRRPILGPNQTPLDYLLSSSSPILYNSNSVLGRFTPNTSTNSSLTVDRQPPPTSAKPRPNLEFVKYLLTLPRYQQALNDLIEAQSSTQT